MIDAPKPSIVWYQRLGSTLTVRSSEPPGRNSTEPRLLSFKAPSGVVTHTCADGVAATAGPATASARRAAVRSVRLESSPAYEHAQDRHCTKRTRLNGVRYCAKFALLAVHCGRKRAFLDKCSACDRCFAFCGPDIRRKHNRARLLPGCAKPERRAARSWRAHQFSRTTVASLVTELEREGLLPRTRRRRRCLSPWRASAAAPVLRPLRRGGARDQLRQAPREGGGRRSQPRDPCRG